MPFFVHVCFDIIIRPLTCLFVHPYSFINLFIQSIIGLSPNASIHSPIVYLLINSSIHPSIHPPIHLSRPLNLTLFLHRRLPRFASPTSPASTSSSSFPFLHLPIVRPPLFNHPSIPSLCF